MVDPLKREGVLTIFNATLAKGRIMNVSVKSCARCGQDHDGMAFLEFANPIRDADGTTWTHWAMCPTNGEPVLIRMKVEPIAEFVNKPDWWSELQKGK